MVFTGRIPTRRSRYDRNFAHCCFASPGRTKGHFKPLFIWLILLIWRLLVGYRKEYRNAMYSVVVEELTAGRPRRRPLLHCGAQSHSLAHDLGIELGNGPERDEGCVGAGPRPVVMHRQLHRPSRRHPFPPLPRSPRSLRRLYQPFSHFKFSATVRAHFGINNEK
ncbi:unnamed protein product [Euphydryas editha]|uniref:Uncharacterized protein n=1 Tax=Euphydryas editha TaxID=104508 RepID=A0AAU9U673_EUPED|nr:unnamed protein product [Euphydryas editha]